MKHRDLLTLLLPPGSYASDGPRLAAELAADGAALDASLNQHGRIRRGITPLFAEQLLPEWERICGLSPQTDAPYLARQEAVLAKLTEVGGLSIPYFTRLAASLGYHISIQEPEPFRAGINRAGDRLWTRDISWVWQVVVRGAPVRIYRFRAGQSAAGERLCAFADPVIESVFNELKPAHTFVYFAYQET